MGRVVRTSACEGDLLKIWRFLAGERKNLAAAERLLRRLDELFRRLSEFPEIGSRQEQYRSGLRAFPAGAYVVFYEPIPGGIRVFRVIHGSRRLEPILQPLRHALPTPIPRPPILGLLGGVASGKSFVAGCFEELGAGRLDADRAGHEVLREPEVVDLARRRWGSAIFDPSGQIVRKRLAEIVFGRDPAARGELRYLEQITHPRIGEKLRDQAHALAAEGKKLLILDAPVMLEAGWDAMCRWVLFIDVPLAERLRRAERRGWSPADFHVREAAQETLGVKRGRADFVLDNSGSPDETKNQVARLWSKLVG